MKWLGAVLASFAFVGVGIGATTSAFGSTPSTPGAAASALSSLKSASILTCRGSYVMEPTSFVITCADANTQLTRTHWSSWTSTGAKGTTRFAMNLCTPYCAASPMSYFANSKVDLSAPVKTKKGTLYSLMVVHYSLHAQAKTYRFSWKGDPSF
ncbi:MAG TPA: hypothetical protein VND89_05370 [Acidimicrobiales bacterium]|nr:hypothetical protein [Acidimicrobiales bacterium]